MCGFLEHFLVVLNAYFFIVYHGLNSKILRLIEEREQQIMKTIVNSYPKSLAIWLPLNLDFYPQRLHKEGHEEEI